jgi:hypothetical protein
LWNGTVQFLEASIIVKHVKLTCRVLVQMHPAAFASLQFHVMKQQLAC